MTVRILAGDCIDEMRKMSNASVDAIVTDPPYGLAFMGKEWDSFAEPGDSPMRRSPQLDAVNAGASRQGGRQRAGADYLKRQAKDMRAFQQQAYEWGLEMERVLKPGGYLLAFGGTRTYHRLACGLEDAGFEIRDSIHWVYGSGFPKSLNLAGGLGTALKPAHEPIVLARKRLSGTVAATVAKYGTGALNVDGARVATNGEVIEIGFKGAILDPANGWNANSVERTPYNSSKGRWPPNLLLSHTPECIEGGACAEDCAVAEMDRQSGELTSGAMRAGQPRVKSEGEGGYHGGFTGAATDHDTPGDSGGASRFFPVFRYEAKPSRAEREAGLSGERVVVKTGHGGGDMPIDDDGAERDRFKKRARNTHPTVKPVALMAWLVQLVTPVGGTVLDPFAGSFTTLIACQRLGINAIGIEREAEYVAIGRARLRGDQPLFYAESPTAPETQPSPSSPQTQDGAP